MPGEIDHPNREGSCDGSIPADWRDAAGNDFYEVVIRYLDGVTDTGTDQRLQQVLVDSPEHCRAYVKICQQTASVRDLVRERTPVAFAGADAYAAPSDSIPIDSQAKHSAPAERLVERARPWWSGQSMKIAAAVLLSLVVLGSIYLVKPLGSGAPGIARIVQINAEPGTALPTRMQRGGALAAGEHWDALTSVYAKVEMADGTTLLIDEQTDIEFVDSNTIRLVRGAVTADVPQEAVGFKVITPRSHVIDLGTRFGVRVGDRGQTHVRVFKGKVRVESAKVAGAAKHEPIVLNANQSIEVGESVGPVLAGASDSGYLMQPPGSRIEAALRKCYPVFYMGFDKRSAEAYDVPSQQLYEGSVNNDPQNLHLNSELSDPSVILKDVLADCDATDRYTIAAWIRPMKAGSQNIFAASNQRGIDYDFGPQLRIRPSGRLEHLGKSGSVIQISSGTLSFERWAFVVISCDEAGRMCLYINGRQAAGTIKERVGAHTKRPDLWVSGSSGRRREVEHHLTAFEGDIDHLTVYDKVLSPEQINALYTESLDSPGR